MFRLVSACVIVCITGTIHEFGKPESFLMGTNHVSPLLQRDTLTLYSKDICTAKIVEKIVQKKKQFNTSARYMEAGESHVELSFSKI